MAQLYVNNLSAVLSGAISDTDTAITVVDGSAMPTPSGGDYFLLTLVGFDGSLVENAWEIIKVTARSGNDLTVVRGQEDTTAVAWSGGTYMELRVTAETMSNKSEVGHTHDGDELTSVGAAAGDLPVADGTNGVGWIPGTDLFATAAQGALADSALQSGDNISELNNDSSFITTSDVRFEHLNGNGDVGVGADQVAQGNHTHTGVYQPLDADLTGIAALANPGIGQTGIPYKDEVGNWNLSTADYVNSAGDTITGAMTHALATDTFQTLRRTGVTHPFTALASTDDVAVVKSSSTGGREVNAFADAAKNAFLYRGYTEAPGVNGGSNVGVFAHRAAKSGVSGGATDLGDTEVHSAWYNNLNTLPLMHLTGIGDLYVNRNVDATAITFDSGSNLLNHYSSGSWTPGNVVGGTVAGSITYNFKTGIYIRIGKLVVVIGTIDIASVATAPTGTLTVSGLPYGVTTLVSQGSVGCPANWTLAATNLQGGGTSLQFLANSLSGVGLVNPQMGTSAAGQFRFSLVYLTA